MDCEPLKVRFGAGHDYFNVADVVVCPAHVELGEDTDESVATEMANAVAGAEAPAKQATAPRFALGDKVNVWSQFQEKWFPGAIVRVGEGQMLPEGYYLPLGWFTAEFRNPNGGEWQYKRGDRWR